jgi:hypothetical protein
VFVAEESSSVPVEEIEENARKELNELIQESEELIVIQAHEEALKQEQEQAEERARAELDALIRAEGEKGEEVFARCWFFIVVLNLVHFEGGGKETAGGGAQDSGGESGGAGARKGGEATT